VEKEMPGWKVVEPRGPIKRFGNAPGEASERADAAGVQSPNVDAEMPSTKELRRKFYGTDADAPDESTHEAVPPDTEILNVKSGDLEGTVGANRRTGKIDWSTG
jgi:hypothetical protein